jgi:hypothetical protein
MQSFIEVRIMIIRKKGYRLLVSAICMAAVSTPTYAWYRGGSGFAFGSHGGSAAWSHGSGVAYGPHGGSAAWSHGTGVAYGPHGGSAAWSGGSGYAHGAYGGAAVWSHPTYGYHSSYYGGGYSSGDVAAAGIAGLAVGAMAGAAAASRPAPAPTTVVVQSAPPPPPAAMPLGTTLTYLPGGCVNINISSGQYYQCGINWFRPYFGSNGAYYQVVPAPY